MTTRADNDDQRSRIFGRSAVDANESRTLRDVADFRRLGMSDADAASAARSLQRGTFPTFREAALSRAAFGESRVNVALISTVEAERRAFDESEKAGGQ